MLSFYRLPLEPLSTYQIPYCIRANSAAAVITFVGWAYTISPGIAQGPWAPRECIPAVTCAACNRAWNGLKKEWNQCRATGLSTLEPILRPLPGYIWRSSKFQSYRCGSTLYTSQVVVSMLGTTNLRNICLKDSSSTNLPTGPTATINQRLHDKLPFIPHGWLFRLLMHPSLLHVTTYPQSTRVAGQNPALRPWHSPHPFSKQIIFMHTRLGSLTNHREWVSCSDCCIAYKNIIHALGATPIMLYRWNVELALWALSRLCHSQARHGASAKWLTHLYYRT